jgi:hypothetical protein
MKGVELYNIYIKILITFVTMVTIKIPSGFKTSILDLLLRILDLLNIN